MDTRLWDMARTVFRLVSAAATDTDLPLALDATDAIWSTTPAGARVACTLTFGESIHYTYIYLLWLKTGAKNKQRFARSEPVRAFDSN